MFSGSGTFLSTFPEVASALMTKPRLFTSMNDITWKKDILVCAVTYLTMLGTQLQRLLYVDSSGATSMVFRDRHTFHNQALSVVGHSTWIFFSSLEKVRASI